MPAFGRLRGSSRPPPEDITPTQTKSITMKIIITLIAAVLTLSVGGCATKKPKECSGTSCCAAK